MQSIYKYRLLFNELQGLDIKSNNILSAKEQYGNIVIYALNDTDLKIINYQFLIIATGNKCPRIDGFKFLDTVRMENGAYIFHVFYKEYLKGGK